MAVDIGGVPAGTTIGTLTIAVGSGSRNSNVIDLNGYLNVVAYWIQSGSGGGNIVAQFSNDGTNWQTPSRALEYQVQNGDFNATSGSFSSIGNLAGGNAGPMMFPAYGRYMRLTTAATTTGSAYVMQLTGFNAPLNAGLGLSQKVVGSISPNDGFTPVSNAGLQAHTLSYGYRGTYEGTWDRLRTPTTYKQAICSGANNNAVWTPQSGRKFRLMRFSLTIPGHATIAAAGQLIMQFNDGPSAGMPIYYPVYLPSAAANAFGAWTTGWVDLGNGILSAAIDRVLNMNLSAAITNGWVHVNVCGTEE